MKSALLTLAVCLCIFSTQNSSAQTYNLHWGSTGWVGPTYNKTITNIGGSGIDATVAIVNNSPAGNVSASGASANDAFQYNTPTVGPANIAWFLPGSTGTNPLVEYVDWNSLTSNVTTTITFSRPVFDVSFYLGDMDRTNPLSYVDRTTFVGKNGTVTVPNPTVTKFQATFTPPDTVLINGNQAYGNASLSNGNAGTSSITTQGCTILIRYNNPITQLTIVWDEGPGATGNPAAQAVVIGDISFSKVLPEYPPTADNFTNAPMPQAYGATTIPGLQAADLDGTISSFRILTLPNATEGVLSIPCPATPAGATCTGGYANLTAAVLSANPGGIVITPAQAAGMRFDPVFNFSGKTSFAFDATDNNGNVSNTATYILPVIPVPPVSNNIMENSMPNTNGPTAIQQLSSSDVDGTITSYQITSLPTAGQGVLSVPCPPGLTGAVCSGGFQDLNATVLSNYPSGIPLNASQMAAMRFDPAPGFLGKATFNYNATDNSGLISNTASYTIPVTATATISRPPLADNIVAQNINNSLSNTGIPPLRGTDLDGTVTSFTIASIPSASHGVLRISCPSTPSGLTCVSGYADVLVGTVLTPSEATRLYFDPLPGFIGNAAFTYTATDNSSLVSNTANYTIPVINQPPTAANINTIVPFNAPATSIPFLSGSDVDGTVSTYTLLTIPNASDGVLSVPCPPTPSGGTCSGGYVNLNATVMSSNPLGIALTPAQAAAIRFAPASGFSGTLNFTYWVVDNSNNTSNIANYGITVAAQPPVSAAVTNPVMPNTNGATAINALSATDADGTISSYTVLELPDPSQGVLSVPCPPTPTGGTCSGGFVNLTAAVLTANTNGISLTPTQAAGMRFDPTAGFTGLAAFKYTATDNDGLQSNVATYTLSVSGSGNIPPVAKNVITPSMPCTNGVTSVPTFVGFDADGTIASYTITALPTTTQGVLSIPCPATPSGATCSGGFADLTAAVLAANTGGIVLTPAQAAGMRFDPGPNFSGNVDIPYTTTDNSGSISAGAVYTIPVTTQPPIANAVIAPMLLQTAGGTAIPAMIASDVDGTIAIYNVESLPSASQGILSVPCPPTFTGATCTGGYQDLTPTVLAAYSTGGIPLTPTQMSGLKFTPSASYNGNIVFNYHVVDNSGMISNSTTYTIPVSGLPPVSFDVIAPKMLNSSSATAIPSLVSSDADGIISSYVITSIPPVSQGVISMPCPTTPTGATCSGGFADLTAAVLAANPGGIQLTTAQAAALRFDPNAGYNGNVLFNYASYDNNFNLSNVAVYTIPTGTGAALPIALVNFTAERNGKDIIAKWSAQNEQDVNRYVVEFSTDGTNYNSGTTVTAIHQTINNNYQATLYRYTQPLYYLRLKIFDADGSYRYSNVVVIKTNINPDPDISLVPNPAKDKVYLKFNSTTAGNADIRIVNSLGETVVKITKQVFAGENNFMIDHLSSNPNGNYIVQMFMNGRPYQAKLVIVNK